MSRGWQKVGSLLGLRVEHMERILGGLELKVRLLRKGRVTRDKLIELGIGNDISLRYWHGLEVRSI